MKLSEILNESQRKGLRRLVTSLKGRITDAEKSKALKLVDQIDKSDGNDDALIQKEIDMFLKLDRKYTMKRNMKRFRGTDHIKNQKIDKQAKKEMRNINEDSEPDDIKSKRKAEDNFDRDKASKNSEREGKAELKKLKSLDTLTTKQKQRVSELERDLFDN